MSRNPGFEFPHCVGATAAGNNPVRSMVSSCYEMKQNSLSSGFRGMKELHAGLDEDKNFAGAK